jgi:hypothetical protein
MEVESAPRYCLLQLHMCIIPLSTALRCLFFQAGISLSQILISSIMDDVPGSLRKGPQRFQRINNRALNHVIDEEVLPQDRIVEEAPSKKVPQQCWSYYPASAGETRGRMKEVRAVFRKDYLYSIGGFCLMYGVVLDNISCAC